MILRSAVVLLCYATGCALCASAGKWTTAAAVSTVAINVLEAPKTVRQARVALRKTRHAVVRTAKKAVGK